MRIQRCLGFGGVYKIDCALLQHSAYQGIVIGTLRLQHASEECILARRDQGRQDYYLERAACVAFLGIMFPESKAGYMPWPLQG